MSKVSHQKCKTVFAVFTFWVTTLGATPLPRTTLISSFASPLSVAMFSAGANG